MYREETKIKLNLDIQPKTLVNEMDALIDPTIFKTVKSYFRNPESEINMVAIVNKQYSLAEIAAFMACEFFTNREETFSYLLKNKIIELGVDNIINVHHTSLKYIRLLDDIKDSSSCYVIYLPPFYVVQLV